MISICNLKNAKQAAGYYEKDDYYKTKQCPSQWWGKGAEEFGLKDQVGRQEFKDLLEGTLPNGTEMPRGSQDRRPGIDLTFSAPKSVSLAAFLGADERIIKAHREAVSKALEWLEQTSSMARITENDQTKTVPTGNLLVAMFEHETSRELDPLLHTHAVVMNITRRLDGEWRAISNEKLFDNRKTADAVYKAELADRLRALGYEIVLTHDDGRFEIKGVTRKQIEHFSQRRMQIVKSLAELGFSSPEAAFIAALDTRKAKKDVDRSVLRKSWLERAKAVGLILKVPSSEFREKRTEASRSREMASGRVARLAVEHFSERLSVFPKEELIRFGLERGTGQVNLRTYKEAISRMVLDGTLIDVGKGRYTTERAIHLEKRILEISERGIEAFRPISDSEKIQKKLKNLDRELTNDQRTALESILRSRDRVTGVQGYPGTGKTVMLSLVRDISEEAGYEVRGFSTAATAAGGLELETGIPSTTLARHLLDFQKSKTPGEKNKKQQLWIVDESSMLGTSQADKLLRFAENSGARVALVGDYRQLPSVEAGKPFALLMERGFMKYSTLETIMRQKDPIQKKAVIETIEGKTRDSVRTLDRHIIQVDNREERLRLVAEEYLMSNEPMEKRPLVVTGTNEDRRDLNVLIRTGLEKRGELSGEAVKGEVLISRDCTDAELKETRTYQPGDVIRFRREYKRMGVEKAEYAEVESVNMDEGTVRLKSSKGRVFDWQSWRFSKVELYAKDGRDLKDGDFIRWTRNDEGHGRKNRELARVISVDPDSKTALLETDSDRQTLDLACEKHWEHAYASTVNTVQGMTKQKSIAHFDTRKKNVVGLESWLVSISRQEFDISIFTDNRQRLPEAIQNIMAQESALDAFEKNMEQDNVGIGKDLEVPSVDHELDPDQTLDKSEGFGFDRFLL